MLRFLQISSIFCVLGLIASLGYGLYGWETLNQNTPLIIATLLILPLVCLLPGLIRGNRRTFGGGSMLILFYICGAVSEAYSNPGVRVLAAAVTVIAVTLFTLMILYAKAAQAVIPSPEESSPDASE